MGIGWGYGREEKDMASKGLPTQDQARDRHICSIEYVKFCKHIPLSLYFASIGDWMGYDREEKDRASKRLPTQDQARERHCSF